MAFPQVIQQERGTFGFQDATLVNSQQSVLNQTVLACIGYHMTRVTSRVGWSVMGMEGKEY